MSPDLTLGAWESATSPKSCLNESHASSTSAKEFINDYETLFRSSMKASRLKRLKLQVSVILGGGGFQWCSLQTAYVPEWPQKPTGITPETYRTRRLVKKKSIRVFEFSVMQVKLSIICRRLNSFVMSIKCFVNAGLFDCFRSKFRSPGNDNFLFLISHYC